MMTKTTDVDTTALLNDIVTRLRSVDKKIRAIVLFGSFVWAPDLARDVDILVITESNMPSDVYWDAVVGLPKEVEVVVNHVGEDVGKLALAVRTGVLLWGDTKAVEEMVKDMPVPTFDDAQRIADRARRYLQIGLGESDPIYRDMDIRNAFNALFDAARQAVMCFLETEETRWGELRRQLPSPFDARFRQIIDTLHVAFFYHGGYPSDRAVEEFDHWQAEVLAFIDALQQAKGQEQP